MFVENEHTATHNTNQFVGTDIWWLNHTQTHRERERESQTTQYHMEFQLNLHNSNNSNEIHMQ